MRGRLISAVIATLLIVSIVAGSTIAFAQTATTNTTKNVTKGAVASAVKSAAASKNVTKGAVQSAAASAVASAKNATGGFLGLPGFEAVYAVAGLLAVAYLLVRRRK
ncbi:MAG TPA: PGF-CTERM sorting domain-containing protein [Candidatus Bathyarchaeia archaeon]|nr:PGF-CTERM sorting domain-containing protein [Candidatus Bathyarchaeia archaeon]